MVLAGLTAPGCASNGDEGCTLSLLTWRPESPDAWAEALAEFERAHPGVRVRHETGPSNSTQLHDLVAQRLLNEDSSLDVLVMDVVWTPEFAAAGWVAAVGDRLPSEERAGFLPASLSADTWEGALYAIPLNVDCGLLYYRKDLVPHAPRTWPELVKAAAAFPHLRGYSAQLQQYEGLVCNLLEFVQGNGGSLEAPAAPQAIEAVTFVRDRIVGAAAPRGILTWEEQQSLDLFQAGGAVFLRSWPYAWRVCSASPTVAGKVGMAPLPSFAGSGSACTLGGWRLGVSAFSHSPEEAWALVRFLTSEAGQRHFAVHEGKAPARTALYRDAAVLAANPHFAELPTILETAALRPRSPVYPQVSHILQRALHAAISDPNSDVAALLEEAGEQMRRARERSGR